MYELTFIRNSHRGSIILCYLVYKNESFFDYVLNDLTTLHEPLHDADMKLSVELKNLQESQTFKDSLIIIIAAMFLIWHMQTDEWVASNRILVFSQRFLGTPRGKHYNSLEIDVWRKAVSRSKETFTKRDHRFFLPLLYHNLSGWCWFKGSVSFVWTTMKYEVKWADWLFTMRMVYCEIDIVFWSRNVDILAFSVLFTCVKSTYSF